MKHHLVIGGTGRTGTSFLVKYLTECGLETHISRNRHFQWDENANSGLEDVPFAGNDCPYLIKSPWLFEYVDDLVKRQDIIVDAVIIPVRDLVEAASSRSILELRARHTDAAFMDQMKTWESWGVTPGGTVYSINPIDQARILALGFHKTIHALVGHGIKIIFLDFPRLAEDADYLYDKLKEFLPSTLEKDCALKAHAKLVDLSKVRTGTEILESTKKTGPQNNPKSFDPGTQYPSFDAVDNIALKRTISTLRKLLEECSLQRDILTGERDALVAEREAMAQRTAQFEAYVDRIQSEQAALQSRVTQIPKLQEELSERINDSKRLRLQIDSIHASLCWRLTWPIRWFHKQVTWVRSTLSKACLL